jgi:hypothetical protein
MTIFKRASLGMNLTPGERALLKLVEGWILAGAVAGLIVFLTAVTQAKPDWGAALKLAATAFIVATGFAALKYLKAQQDSPLYTSAPPPEGAPPHG